MATAATLLLPTVPESRNGTHVLAALDETPVRGAGSAHTTDPATNGSAPTDAPTALLTTVTPGEPRKPANFGRNPDGTPRASFTSEELACAQAIMQSAARRHAQS